MSMFSLTKFAQIYSMHRYLIDAAVPKGHGSSGVMFCAKHLFGDITCRRLDDHLVITESKRSE
jgi:hypothetical protein